MKLKINCSLNLEPSKLNSRHLLTFSYTSPTRKNGQDKSNRHVKTTTSRKLLPHPPYAANRLG